MSERIEMPYGFSTSFQPTGREKANGPCGDSAIPLAIRSRLPPPAMYCCRRCRAGALSESGVPAKISTFTSGPMTVSLGVTLRTV